MRKKVLLGIVALLVVVAVFSILRSTEKEINNHPSKNIGVVAFGDSLVEGVGSTRGGGFVKILSEELNVPILNLGRSGDTTTLAFKRVNEVVLARPALTIILLGGNDFLQGFREAETRAGLEKIIEAIQATGSAVMLVGIESDIQGNNHREIFETLSDQYGTLYVPDILEGIYGNKAFMSDNLHPNDEGYKLMAERIKATLASI